MFIFEKKDIQNLRNYIWFLIPASALIAQAVIASWINFRSPFWLDEVATGAMACQPAYTDVLKMAAGDVHPPIFALWVHAIFYLFGCKLIFVRIINFIILTGSAGTYCFYIKRRFGTLSGLIFATIFFGSPTVWHYAWEARSYALLTAASICVAYAVISNAWSLCLAAAVAGAALHYFGAWLFIVQALMFYMLNGRISSVNLTKMLIAGAFVSLLYVYSLLSSVGNMASFSHSAAPSWLTLPVIPCVVFFGSINQSFFAFIFMPLIVKLPSVAKQMCRFEKTIAFGLPFISFLFIIGLFFIAYHKGGRLMFALRYMIFLVPLTATGISILSSKISENYFSKPENNIALKLFALITAIYISLGTASVWEDRNSIRPGNWNNAANNSVCSRTTCGFVLDEPSFLAMHTAEHYNAIANFLLRSSNKKDFSWVAIQPQDLALWIANNPDTPFVYVKEDNPTLNFEELIRAFGLSCSTDPTQPVTFVCQKQLLVSFHHAKPSTKEKQAV
jgi:hypothetical protein